jgi:hypothetical protein
VFENRVLRRIFEPKRERGSNRIEKLCNEVHNLYFSANITVMTRPRWTEWAGLAKTLFGKPGGKSQLWRPTLRQEDNIKADLKEIVREVVELIHLAQNSRNQWLTCERCNKLSGSVKGGEFRD